MRLLPHIPLSIAGEGPQLLELQRLAHELNLENVSFLGHLQGRDLEQAIASSRFTVFPSLCYEVLGKTILESYAQARPVIATDLGSRRELVMDGKTGLLYPPGDPIALASCIASLYSQPGLAESMGTAGRNLVQNRHSPEQHLLTLMRIYERLTAATHRISPSARKLKVAFIGGRGVVSKYSGIETYYEEVGKRLVELGHDVTIYCRSYFTPPLETYLGMRLLRLPTVRTKHLDTLIHTFLSTVHACFSDYDIVHYHALGPALFSFFPRLTGKKTIATVQGLDWQRKKWGRTASRVLRLGEKAAISFPNATMVVSRVLADYYRSRHGGHQIYIPNGTLIRTPGSVRYLPEWQLEPGNYILFLGRFSPEKNCDLLIRAYERLTTDVKLVLAGGSSYSDAYTRELQSHASDSIRLLNWVSGERLQELLSNAMLFVLPSDMEGLSLALLDAMGAGLCVVTSNVPENRELVQGVGYTFSPGNEFALSELLRRLIADPSLRETSGRAAQERIRQQYLWPDISRRIEQEYFRILGQSAASDETARTAA
jgi:glycosyltransferase involved in cell wall biosynthesis